MTQNQNTKDLTDSRFTGRLGGSKVVFSQTIFDSKRVSLSSNTEYIQKQQGAVSLSEVNGLPGTIRAAPAIQTAASAFISLGLIIISLSLIYTVLENLPMSSTKQESLRDLTIICLLIPMLILYFTNKAIVNSFANMFTVSKQKQLANIMKLQRTLANKGNIQINLDGFINVPKKNITPCIVHGSSMSEHPTSKKDRHCRNNSAFDSIDNSKKVLFSDSDESYQYLSFRPPTPTKMTSSKLSASLFDNSKLNDKHFVRESNVHKAQQEYSNSGNVFETASKIDDMNSSMSSCSTNDSFSLLSNRKSQDYQCTCLVKMANISFDSTNIGLTDLFINNQKYTESMSLNYIDKQTLDELLQTNSLSFNFNCLEAFLLLCNISQYFMDMKEVFLVKAWLIITTLILLYFFMISNYTSISAELEQVRKDETNNPNLSGQDKPCSKDSAQSEINKSSNTFRGLSNKQTKKRMKQTSVSNLLKQEKGANGTKGQQHANNQVVDEKPTLVLDEKDLRENRTLMFFNSAQILKQVGECLLRTCFFIFNVLMFCISVMNVRDQY